MADISVIKMPNNQSYNLKDAEAREEIENLITISTTQPSSEDTKLWINNDASGSVQVPTVSEMNTALAGKVSDVQIGGNSIVSNGVATIPVRNNINSSSTDLVTSAGINSAFSASFGTTDAQIKGGTQTSRAISPVNQHKAVFYGLAKAAGDSTQSSSDNAVGTYTNEAKAAIQSMLDVPSTSSVTSQISTAIGNVHQFELSIQQSLPTQDIDTHTIYLIPKTGETNDVYDEYVYINNAWEMIGNTQIDLSNYATKSELPTLTDLIDDTIGNGTTNKTWSADKIYDELDLKAPKASPVFTGSISLGRKNNTTIGNYSIAIGKEVEASAAGSVAIGNKVTATGGTAHAEGFTTTASAIAAHAEGTKTVASGEASHAEGNKSTASNAAAHAEGIYTTASGLYSHAEGQTTTASGYASHTEGYNTIASGYYCHAEGNGSIASVQTSHAEGLTTKATTFGAHSEGFITEANGEGSHSEGYHTIANAQGQHTGGYYNIADSYDNWNEWVANTSYSIGDKVKVTITENDTTTITGYICKIANNDSVFTSENWNNDQNKMNYLEIIGNGTSDNRANARVLDRDGNERICGNVYVGCNSDSTDGTRLPHDVQVNNVSVVANGVANIPIGGNAGGSSTTLGVVCGNAAGGIIIDNSTGEVMLSPANSNAIKAGTHGFKPISVAKQHEATFYGLAKAASADMASSSNAVGTYTDAAKTAIQTMLGTQAAIEVIRL